MERHPHGAGTYVLGETLRIAPGVSIRGAGPGRTKLDASGVGTGLRVAGSAPGHDTELNGLQVAGADTCIRVDSGARAIRLAHLVAHDCRSEGVLVDGGASAAIDNATLVSNGRAVRALGAVTIKNSLLGANGVALVREEGGTLASTYDDLFDNQTDYLGTTAGAGDFSAPVVFAAFAQRDLRLLTTQPSTDRGDPADSQGDEPVPHGARINLGAFGGTADAEPSAWSSTAVSPEGARPVPSVVGVPAPAARAVSPRSEPGAGCALAGRRYPDWLAVLAAVALILVGRARQPRLRPTSKAERRQPAGR